MADLTYLDAIKQVLREEGGAMHYTAITDAIIEKGLHKTLGATPAATVSAAITQTIRSDPKKTPFIRTSPGVYMLREQMEEQAGTAAAEPADKPGEFGIIGAYGMFWDRAKVNWSSKFQLLGIERLGAAPVDFYDQRGVYLLHDRGRTVYVGREVKRSLGLRLYEHTRDRLSGRWERFSWFGIKSVNENGVLVELNIQTLGSVVEMVITTMEGLFIEGLEPTQNRRGGDGISVFEYLQAEDPGLKQKATKALLKELEAQLG